jgi:hypothetical protein
MTYQTVPIATRIARARKWHRDNKPFFDALYGPETSPHQIGALPRATEPRRWREENKARFDALYGAAA